MNILIKGMEMPKNCKGCMFADFDDVDFDYELYCTANEKYADLDMDDHPMGWDCPLIELPPHGRLGDLDALYAEISNGNKAYNGIEGYDGEYPNIANVDDCLEAIKYAETVIEGSET